MLTSETGDWTIAYYNVRVKREIFSLPTGIRSDYLRLLRILMKHGPALRLPHSRALGDGLFELRPHGEEGIGRVFYCTLLGQRIVMLHSFVKKTQQTPDDELRIARKRMMETKRNG
ncbi:type II toxin-antitoxin system RelE/ParE family toxin [Caballeronia sp. GAFFF2]|uniref:type II toxin-antitoxin system RelE/ParE family toxin n=1 Tax=Caballeronia sp. GAFFF2 TaxID=2921741 RepID=UPI002028C058|nr:type II toxin-antitoxin system RelE/ParE family toxin [Caballeronia sp. GAFFF2]